MGGEFTNQNGIPLVLTHSHINKQVSTSTLSETIEPRPILQEELALECSGQT